MSNPFARFALARASPPAKQVKQEPDRPSPVAAIVKKRKREVESDDDALIPVKQEAEAQVKSETPEDKRLTLLKQIIDARAKTVTPIDEFGTQACVAPDLSDVASPEERGRLERFQLLVAALLSSQTNDKITHAAMQRLHRHSRALAEEAAAAATLPSFLSIATIQATSEAQLDTLLSPVGFHRRKAQQIKQIAERLRHRGDIPQSLDELQALPGIGPKIARVILLLAWDKADGLIVDTHVHRLAQRLHWVPSPSKTAEDTRKELEQWVPRELWGRFSLAVVGFGQTVCIATRPKCGSCPLAQTCPSAFHANEKADKPQQDAGDDAL